MRKTNRLIPVIFLVILAYPMTLSCSKKTVTTTKDPLPDSAQAATTPEQASASVQQEDLVRSQMASEADSGQQMMTVLLEDIYFEFDKSTLTSQAQKSLLKKAKWLRANLDVKVIIEGHCDERGTNEYNLALGDRRAAGAKKFLVDLGISPSRLTTISYGEEQPLDLRHTEDAWAKNRRAHFGIE